jgi:hypothetical protein
MSACTIRALFFLIGHMRGDASHMEVGGCITDRLLAGASRRCISIGGDLPWTKPLPVQSSTRAAAVKRSA